MTTFPHVRLVASGTLGATGGNEIWSCGLKVGLALPGALNTLVAPTSSDLSQLANAGFLAWIDVLTNQANGSLFGSDANLTAVKASAVAASGRDDPSIPAVPIDATAAHRGTVSPGPLPYSVSIAATFRGTTWRRGAASVGRIYLPKPDGMGDLVNGLMTTASALKFARQVGVLLDKINSLGTLTPGTLTTSGRVPMVSNISTSAAASGLRWQNVTSVTVDTRPDTVRRRSNKLGGLGLSEVVLPVV